MRDEQRRAMWARINGLSNKRGVLFYPDKEKYIINKYLPTYIAKQKFVEEYPKSEFYPLRVAQDVSSQLEVARNRAKGYIKVPISVIEGRNEKSGYYFFSPETRKFFASRNESDVFQKRDSNTGYFVTSEKRGFDDNRRAFTVRNVDVLTGKVGVAEMDTVFAFNKYATRRDALNKIKELIR